MVMTELRLQNASADYPSYMANRSYGMRTRMLGTRLLLLILLFAVSEHVPALETWRHVASGAIESNVVVDDTGNVSFAVHERWLYRLDPAGDRSFRVRLSEAVGDHIMALSDGSVVVSTAGGDIKRITPSGQVAWRLRHDENAELEAMAAGNRGVLYLVYANGGVRAINYAGHPVWAVDVGDPVVHGPKLTSDGNIHVVTEEGELLVLNAQADVEQSFQLDRMPSHIAIDSDDELLLIYDGLQVERVDPVAAERRIIASGAAEHDGGRISDVFVDGDGTVSLFRDDGVLLRHTGSGETGFRTIADSLRGAAAVGDGSFVISEMGGVLRRVDSYGQTTMTLRTRSGGGELFSPVVGRGGHVAVSGSEWTVHGLLLDSVDGRAFRGTGGGAAADGRIGPVRSPDRESLLGSPAFRARLGLIERGDTTAAERLLEDIEKGVSEGDLRGMSLWASELLLMISDDRDRRKIRASMPADLVRRSLTLLGRIGDATAALGLEVHALGESRPEHPDAVMEGLSYLGYSYRHRRSDVIDIVYARAGGPGVSAGLDAAYLDAIELVWRQGGAISERVIERIARLPHEAREKAARDRARRLLGRFSTDPVRLLNGTEGSSRLRSLEWRLEGL